MFCPKCGTQNPETGRFCRSCGADLGSVAAALSGKPSGNSGFGMIDPIEITNMTAHKGRSINWQSAITNIFMGFAFLAVSIILGITDKYNGQKWWFWLLIPAFGCFGSGIAQMVQLKKSENRNAKFASPPTGNVINSAPAQSALPPNQTDYVSPPKASIYDTGGLADRPGSVTEPTTRHLKMDSEGETRTLPKK